MYPGQPCNRLLGNLISCNMRDTVLGVDMQLCKSGQQLQAIECLVWTITSVTMSHHLGPCTRKIQHVSLPGRYALPAPAGHWRRSRAAGTEYHHQHRMIGGAASRRNQSQHWQYPVQPEKARACVASYDFDAALYLKDGLGIRSWQR